MVEDRDMRMVAKPLISVVLPAYNEGKSIAKVVSSIQSELQKAACNHEIIVVDDGSQDNTYEELKGLAGRNASLRGVKLSRNFGKESALLLGLKTARGDAVVTMDADLQHPPAIIHDMIAKWQEGYKVVHAIKENRHVDSVLVRMRAAMFNQLFKILGGICLQKSSDFILLDREAVDKIIKLFPERERFYRGLVHWIGFKQTTVSFRVENRIDGSKSRFSLPALLKLALTGLVSFTSAPLHIISILGVLSLFIGLIIGLDALISWAYGRAVSGFATIIMTLLIMGGFSMISLGIISEYIGKIYEEVKGRPSYIVESSVGFKNRNKESGQELQDKSNRLQ